MSTMLITYLYRVISTLPPTVRVTLPSFNLQNINRDRLSEMFGTVSSLSINTEPGDTMTPPVRPLLDEPRLTAAIHTGYKEL
jgi:hypothetical protein